MTDELELPEPPQLPMPSVGLTALAVFLQLALSEVLFFLGTSKAALFFSGVASTTAGVSVATYVLARRKTKQMQAEMEATTLEVKTTFEQAALRMRMIPRLLERHGASQTMELMHSAEHLVQDGDFVDIRDAVASLERFNDMEPTTYGDEAD